MGLIILFHANVPLKLWIDHLINWLSSTTLHFNISFHKLYKRHAEYSGIWIFGYRVNLP